jgi:sec-independent protein translocase protein TatA
MLLFLDLGGGEIMMLMLAVLLLFGSKKIPEFAKSLGKGIREFKDATNSIKEEIKKETPNFDNEKKIIDEIKDLTNKK